MDAIRELNRMIAKAPSQPGIYRLYNRSSKRSYVGRAVNLRRRLSTHLRYLIGGGHCQPALKAAFSQWGPEHWHFEVLQTCSRVLLAEMEKRYASKHAVFGMRGYNVAPIIKGEDLTEQFAAIARRVANDFHGLTPKARIREIARKAAQTKRLRVEAKRRSETAQKAWATRVANRAAI